MWSKHPEIAQKWANEADTPEPERHSHPWQAPDSVLQRYGIELEYEHRKDELEDLLVVNVKNAEGDEIGEVNLLFDPDRDVYQITYSQLEGLPRGSGIGTSVYRSIRQYVGQHFGKTIASDYTRSPFANRAWGALHKSGLAKRKVVDPYGIPLATDKARELDYYVMDAKEKLPGGKASGMSPSDFSKRELAMGIKHELEHTGDRELAREIAMDHLAEDPEYYSKLAACGRLVGMEEDIVTHRKRNGLLQAYRKAGAKTNHDIVAMAAANGLVAQAEVEAALADQAIKEQRENSTAMIVVPGSPPGRNICSLIRKMIADRSKLIVVAMQGDLPPGAFERMLRASMPDVEKKLRVMDASGPSLADALNMAERNRHYRPSQALEVFCSSEQAPGFSQEVRDGSLKFDPTVITVRPIEIPRDDANDIKKAVESDDESAMHRVLDPHVFSDQDSLHDYSQALLHTELFAVIGSLVREFLTDIAKDKKSGVRLIVNIIEENWDLLEERGLDMDNLDFLGAGNNGAAWKTGDGRVLKVTTDDAEAHVAVHIKGKKFKHIFEVHDAFAFPGTYSGHYVYGIITESGLEKPSESERDDFDWMVELLEKVYDEADQDLYEGKLKKVLQAMMASQLEPQYKRRCLELVKEFDLPGITADIQRLGYAADLHSGNFMRRNDGTYVLIDIGTGGSQDSQRPPFLEGDPVSDIVVPPLDNRKLNEFGLGSGGTGAASPPSMRGSNSSAWASGKNALGAPRNNVPEEDDEDQEEEFGGSLDWGKAGRFYFGR